MRWLAGLILVSVFGCGSAETETFDGGKEDVKKIKQVLNAQNETLELIDP